MKTGVVRVKLKILLLSLVMVILLSSINCGLCAGQSQSQLASSYMAESLSDIVEGEYDSAISKITRAKEEFEKVDDKEGVVDSLNLLAYIYYLKGDYKKAESTANQAYENALTLGYEKGLVDYYINLGFIYMDWEMYDKAEDYANRANKKSKEIKYDKGTADALYCIGGIYAMTSKHNEALEYYNRSKQISEDMNYETRLIESLVGLGFSHWAKFNYEKCMMYCDQALEKANEINYERGRANALEQKGDAYSLRGDYDKALEYYNQALDTTKEIGIKKEKAVALGEIGNVYLYKKDYQNAKDYYMRSKKIFEELGCSASLSIILVQLGYVYMGLSESEKAKDCFDTAERYAEEVVDPDASLCCYYGLADLHYKKGDYDEAIKYYERSLNVLKGRENRDLEIANLLLTIGQIYTKKEDYDMAIKYYDDAIEYYNQSLDIFSKETNEKMVMFSLAGIGDVYGEKGYAYYAKGDNSIALENYNTALEYCNQSWNIYSEIKDERILETDDELNIADICNSYGRFGILVAYIYEDYEDYETTTEFYDLSIMWHETALSIDQNITNLIVAEQGVAVSYYNIGLVYYYKKDYSTALEYYKQSLEKYEELKMDREAVTTLFAIAETYESMGNYEDAIQNYKKIDQKEFISKEQKAEVNRLMGSVYTKWGQKLSGKEQEDAFDFARYHLNTSHDLYMSLNQKEEAKKVEREMSDIPSPAPTLFRSMKLETVLALATILIAIIGGVGGFYLKRRKQRFVGDMLERTDNAYTEFKMNSVTCDRELLKLRDEAFRAYKKHIIDENNFLMLEKRIKEHLSDVKKRIITERLFGSFLPPRIDDMFTQMLADGAISDDSFLAFKKMVDESTELNERVKRELNILIEEWKSEQK